MANMHLVTGYAGKEHVTAADHGAFNTALFGSGQFVLNTGNKLAASSPSNNTVRILDGDLLMQGRHVRLNEGTCVDLSIENGAQGYYRNDLIVARYTKNESTGVEEVNLVVIKGTAAASNPADPEYTSGNLITDHAIQNDMPLYRVVLNGLVVEELVPVFTALEVNIPALLELIHAHFHSADDITGGILPVSRGGTGVGSISELLPLLGSTKIATGSYIGTGTYGASNPNKLTFGFKPKFFMLYRHFGLTPPGNATSNGFAVGFVWGEGQTSYYHAYGGETTFTTTATGISWYSTNLSAQHNASKDEYLYFAIG